VNEREILRKYGQMKAWVARERRRLKRTGERPTQQYLRRSRLVDDTDPISLRELLRELRSMETQATGRRTPDPAPRATGR